MKKYIIKRLMQLIPILFAITFLSYGMMRVAGSDVVEQKMENTGSDISQEVYNGEWLRVLKPGGKLLNFDTNWYHHLFDEEKRRAYEEDRKQVETLQMEDHYTCTDIDAMENIARQIPMSQTMRPTWDLRILENMTAKKVQADEQVWKRVWDATEKVNYASTPMFLVSAVKG